MRCGLENICIELPYTQWLRQLAKRLFHSPGEYTKQCSITIASRNIILELMKANIEYGYYDISCTAYEKAVIRSSQRATVTFLRVETRSPFRRC